MSVVHLFLRAVAGALLLVFTLLMALPPAKGDQIQLKDGTFLYGWVKRETKIEVDPSSKEPYTVPEGPYFIDDGPRRIYFSQNLVAGVEKKEQPQEIRFNHKSGLAGFVPLPKKMPAVERIVEVTNWDDKWYRKITYGTGNLTTQLPQHIGAMTPYWTRVDSTAKHAWTSVYLTSELGPETVLNLLRNHPDLEETARLKEPQIIQRRYRFAEFLVQAGWYAEAELQLQRVLADFPKEKEKVETNLALLGTFRARELGEEIKRLYQAGQYEGVQRKLAAFPEKQAVGQVLNEIEDLKSKLKEATAKTGELQKHLAALPALITGGERALFQDAVTAISAELNFGNYERLDTFLGQARQAVRQRQEGQTPKLAADQLLALAITGWLLGSPAAESRPDTAIRLWKARTFVLEYLKTPNPGQRAQMLAAFQAHEKGDQIVDWVQQMLPHLPPPDPEPNPNPKVTEVTTGGPQARGGATYLLQLPPEYRHSQSYPVLIALHEGGEKPLSVLRLWSELAADRGYILVAPSWSQGLGGGYGYSEREHATVLETLHHLRTHYNVDSDRVFLFGLGQGGNMAFDVGLSHPDLFAGVVPMGGTPAMHPKRCWHNGQYLPFYVVGGSHSGEANRLTKELFDQWTMRNYPSLWIQYKGRGNEWFSGEAPLIMDWMRVHRRNFPLHQLGTDGNDTGLGNEFNTLRQSDNHFYWLSSDAINPRNCQNGAWNNAVIPASLTGRIDPDSNVVTVKTTGLKQVTIWLGRSTDGKNMINFDKPVTVRVGLKELLNARKFPPNLGVLLEDLHQRGDRQRPFLAKIDLNL
jgi:pimeloyl-ACP methyl ester carboxylesterase